MSPPVTWWSRWVSSPREESICAPDRLCRGKNTRWAFFPTRLRRNKLHDRTVALSGAVELFGRSMTGKLEEPISASTSSAPADGPGLELIEANGNDRSPPSGPTPWPITTM